MTFATLSVLYLDCKVIACCTCCSIQSTWSILDFHVSKFQIGYEINSGNISFVDAACQRPFRICFHDMDPTRSRLVG